MDTYDGYLVLSDHFFDQGVGTLAGPDDLLFIRKDKHRVFDIVIALKVALWFEAHQSHAQLVKRLDLPHFRLSDLDFLITDRVKSADFLPIERLACFVADETLG